VDRPDDESEGDEEGDEESGDDEAPPEEPTPEKPPEKPAEKPREKPADQPKPKPDEAGGEVPPVPAPPAFTTELLSGSRLPNFIGIHQGRLAIFRPTLKGIEFYGYLQPAVTPLPEAITKISDKDFKRTAEFGNGVVRITLAVPTKTPKEVFAAQIELRVKGAPADGWRSTKE
jgi:hypothetical protein